MKKFIKKIFLFIILLLLLNIVIFVFANDNYYKGYKDFPSKKYHSFIIADSHGIPLEKFGEKYQVFNFSSSSDSYLDMQRKIKYLVENNYKIDTIYLSVDRHTLSPYRDQFNNADKSIIYTYTVDYSYLKEKYLKYYFPIFQTKVNPLLKIYLQNKIRKLFFPKAFSSQNIPWQKLPQKEKKIKADERATGQFPTTDNSKSLEKTLLDIIDICHANNIELIGVKFPITNAYIEELGDKNYGADQLFIDNNLKVIDCESIFVGKQNYFIDEDHLNSKGGEEMIKVLFSK